MFFASISGVTTFLLCALRNFLLARDRLTGGRCCLLVALVAVIGIWANNRGTLGLLPVITTSGYSMVCLYAKRTETIKLNIVVNLTLWAVYDWFILDYVAFAVDSVSALLALVSLFRRKEYTDHTGRP